MTDPEILKVEAELLAAQKKLHTVIKHIQKNCAHPSELIVEGEYQSDSWGHNHTPPFRVCKLCGYAEEGWHCGYWRLDAETLDKPTIPRNVAMTFVKGRIHSQEIMCEVRYGRKNEDCLWES